MNKPTPPSEETKKYLNRVIERLDEIIKGPPFEIRDKLREFIYTLAKVTSEETEV